MDPHALESAWSDAVRAAAKSLWGLSLGDAHKPFVEPPQDLKFGDITSGVAMRLAKELRKPPRAIADELRKKLLEMKPPALVSLEVAGAGYLNFTADRSIAGAVIRAARTAPESWGRSAVGAGEKVLVEHTSANPTGPLHIAHARQAAIGDSLANLLDFAGFSVGREFYVNDTGNQIENLGKSILWRIDEGLGGKYQKEEKDDNGAVIAWKFRLPAAEFSLDLKNAYQGAYIVEIVERLREKHGDAAVLKRADAVAYCATFGKEQLLSEIKEDLGKFRVRFDIWTSQEELEKSGMVERLVQDLTQRGLTYEKDGALWIRTKDLGHDKDDVIRKSDGAYTYRMPDTAYHVDKFARGWSRVIDLWGPDHHEHVGYMTTALKALGHAAFRVLIVQICHLFRGKEEVKFSKRTGNIYTLRELIDEVGVDAARYLFAMRRTDSPFDFDIEVLKSTSMDNPVWYVGYAHARICSIGKKGVAEGRITESDLPNRVWSGDFDESALSDAEILLLRHVRQFHRAVERAARDLDPSVICAYLYGLSTAFQSYYQTGSKDETKRVLCVDEPTRRARLAACAAVQITIRNGLKLLGVVAPERLSSAEA
jgi:arginyl-tRNA synthetase